MKIKIIEPLGIPNAEMKNLIEQRIGAEHEIVSYNTRAEAEEVLIERSKDADVIVVSNIKMSANVISQCTDLKMICVAFTGVDHIDTAYCQENHIVVCNCVGYSTSAVADIVFAMALNLARNVIRCNEVCRQQGTKNGLVGFELEGKTFGVVGMGNIGARVAAIANAFGCKVLAYNRSQKNIEDVEFVDLETLLRRSDIVSLHIPANEQTKGLIGKEQLKFMKDTAFLINTARGAVVDTEALADALKNGQIAGAGIDVFDEEPPIPADNPLLGLDHTVLTPHVAFASAQSFEKRAVIIAENIKAWMDGRPQNVVTVQQ